MGEREELEESVEVAGAIISSCVLIASGDTNSHSLGTALSCIVDNMKDHSEFPKMALDKAVKLMERSKEGRNERVKVGERVLEFAREARRDAIALVDQNKALIRAGTDRESMREPIMQMVNLASETEAMEAVAGALLEESRELLRHAVEASTRPPPVPLGAILATGVECQCEKCVQARENDELPH